MMSEQDAGRRGGGGVVDRCVPPSGAPCRPAAPPGPSGHGAADGGNSSAAARAGAVPPGEAARLADALEAFAAFRQRDGEALTASWNRHDALRARMLNRVCANASAIAALLRAGPPPASRLPTEPSDAAVKAAVSVAEENGHPVKNPMDYEAWCDGDCPDCIRKVRGGEPLNALPPIERDYWRTRARAVLARWVLTPRTP